MRQSLVADRYRLVRMVGRGGMGRVWLAVDEVLHREVAAKEVTPPVWMGDDERDQLLARTMREARTTARLTHPNVVRIYDVVQDQGNPWIIMEYVPSRSLQEILEHDGPLGQRRVAELGLALLGALRAAHRAGVLHRDVKPHNVLVADDGRLMLTDFGLAIFDGDGGLTRSGVVLGSPQYVAPERVAHGVSTVAGDLWSLGASLYAAVEGRSPYARSTPLATLSALASEPPDLASRAGPLAEVLTGLLRRDPARRLTADEAERLLRRVLDDPPVDAAADVAADAAAPAQRPARPASHGPAARPVMGQPADRAPPARPTPARDAVTGQVGEARPRLDRGPLARWRPRRLGRLLIAVVAGLGLVATGFAFATVRDDPPERSTGATGGAATGGAETGGAVRPGGVDPGGIGPGPGPAGTALGRPPEPPGVHPGPGGGPPPVGPPPFGCRPPPPPVGRVTVAVPPPGARALPTGWTWHSDAAGFRVAAPLDWEYFTGNGVLCFHEPFGPRVLIVDPDPAARDPAAYWRLRERQLRDDDRVRGYELVATRPLRRHRGAEWEFRWTGPEGQPVRTSEMLVDDDRRFAVVWHTPEITWTENLDHLELVRDTFTPTR